MVDIRQWMNLFTEQVKKNFPDRIECIGLQGSYGRGEASADSDIDVVLILDQLDLGDLQTYSAMLDALPCRELVCGFLSGKEELRNWEPADLFQFYYDTTPIMGSLDWLTELIDEEAVEHAIRIGGCNLYHGCVHNLLHEKSPEILKSLYKSAVFVLQAIVYRRTGTYCKRKPELLAAVSGQERRILEISMDLKSGIEPGTEQFLSMSETLFRWTKRLISGEE